ILNGAAVNPGGTRNVKIVGAATITSQGHNISSDGTGNLINPSDLPNTNPLLATLGFHGGATPTIPTLFNNPALHEGDPFFRPTPDQGGAQRGASGGFGSMANAGIVPDIGAYEQSSLYVVTQSDVSTTPPAYETSVVGTLLGGVNWANENINVLVLNSTPNVI